MKFTLGPTKFMEKLSYYLGLVLNTLNLAKAEVCD